MDHERDICAASAARLYVSHHSVLLPARDPARRKGVCRPVIEEADEEFD